MLALYKKDALPTKLTLPAKLTLLLQLASTLELVAAVELIHRDVKPANVLLFDNGSYGMAAKLCDFGLSKSLTGSMAGSTAGQKGTPAYQDPESYVEKYSTATDVYAYTVMFNEVLTEEVPFNTISSHVAIMMAVCMKEERPTLYHRKPSIDSCAEVDDTTCALQQFIAQGWNQEAANRWTFFEATTRLMELVHRSVADMKAGVVGPSSVKLLQSDAGTKATNPFASSEAGVVSPSPDVKLVRSDADMKGAVELWCSNESAAMERYGNISNWDTAAVTNMKELFKDAKAFNGDVSTWDVSSVTNMLQMFYGAAVFNGDVSTWNVSSVTTMSYMFNGAAVFNGDVSTWNVSSVTDMSSMFYGAAAMPEKFKPVFKR